MSRLKRSFTYAIKGIFFALKNEKNFQIETIISIIVIFLMFLFPLSPSERSLIFLAIALVLALELANTALERVMDILKPRIHPYARVIKDVMAGAVLLATFFSIAIGLVVFSPYFLALFYL